ncbi:hypothetical protein F4782DRAFT_511995 [Xylaria castorea]|nr:hypothetical protein F4782DRAFT_511995 [Xylaria castorea]
MQLVRRGLVADLSYTWKMLLALCGVGSTGLSPTRAICDRVINQPTNQPNVPRDHKPPGSTRTLIISAQSGAKVAPPRFSNQAGF